MSLRESPEDRLVVPCIIDNESLAIDDRRIGKVYSSTGEANDPPVHYYQIADKQTCEDACKAAGVAFVEVWKDTNPIARENILLKAATIYEKKQRDLVEAQRLETSCDEAWAIHNVTLAVQYIRNIANYIRNWSKRIVQVDECGRAVEIYNEALGPILVIPPWNAAIVLATRSISAALATGCTVVLKASETSPLTHNIIVQIFHEAGCPPGVLNSLQASREKAESVTDYLIAHASITKIDFIGSRPVAIQILKTAAEYLKPVFLELGGKCPAIILDDADIQRAATLCAKGVLTHHGQTCFSTERIIVHKDIHLAFVKELIKAFKGTPSGTAATPEIAANALSILRDAEEKGAVFLYGAPKFCGKNAVHPSLVQIDPTTRADQMRIVDEESFGPMATLCVVDNDDEAIELANRSQYGLTATIHTNSTVRFDGMCRKLRFGQVHCNASTMHVDPDAPQGGVKGSGWGRQNGIYGMNEFSAVRHVSRPADLDANYLRLKS